MGKIITVTKTKFDRLWTGIATTEAALSGALTIILMEAFRSNSGIPELHIVTGAAEAASIFITVFAARKAMSKEMTTTEEK